jgi:homoserine O-acetyltransferase
VLAINSADDERNPPDLGVMERELKKVRNARMLWIPGSADTAGHGTTANAKWRKAEFDAWFRGVPKRAD